MPTFCKHCGELVPGDVCPKCGSSSVARQGDTFAADGDDVVHKKYTDR